MRIISRSEAFRNARKKDDREVKQRPEVIEEFLEIGRAMSKQVEVVVKPRPHVVTTEFKRVQSLMYELDKDKALSPGEKRIEAFRLVNNFKAFLRTKNIRYRDVWRKINVPDF